MKKYTEAQAAKVLTTALQALPDNYLECRDMRHAWYVEEDFHVVKSLGTRPIEVQRVIGCRRCTSKRVEHYQPGLNHRLVKVSQNIKYAPGYLLHDVPRGNKPSSLINQVQFERAMERVAQAQRTAG